MQIDESIPSITTSVDWSLGKFGIDWFERLSLDGVKVV
jgi:hypothetical protein